MPKNHIPNQFDDDGAGGTTRRTLVKGAAWSMPIIASATALPVASATEPCEPEGFIETAIDGQGQPLQDDQTFVVTIPTCATSVTFDIRGGDGGRYGSSTTTAVNGRGAWITGALALAPGSTHTIRLVAGGRGAATEVVSLVQPSIGFGNGGKGHDAAGSGGAGSAIILDGVPLVVAGGGGGAGNGSVTVGQDGLIFVTAPESGQQIGRGSAYNAPTGNSFKVVRNGDLVYIVGGGLPGDDTTGGLGAVGPVTIGTPPGDPVTVDFVPGLSGGNHGTGNLGGGNGGDGGPGGVQGAGGGTGGGGGGWAGGGGGGGVIKLTGTSGQSSYGSGGGAGSSYFGGPGVSVATFGPRIDPRWALPDAPAMGAAHGYVRISWS